MGIVLVASMLSLKIIISLRIGSVAPPAANSSSSQFSTSVALYISIVEILLLDPLLMVTGPDTPMARSTLVSGSKGWSSGPQISSGFP